MTWIMIKPTALLNGGEVAEFKGWCETPDDILSALQKEDDIRTRRAIDQYDEAVHSFREKGNVTTLNQNSVMRGHWLTRTPVRIIYRKDYAEASAVVTHAQQRVVLYEFYQVLPNTIVTLIEDEENG